MVDLPSHVQNASCNLVCLVCREMASVLSFGRRPKISSRPMGNWLQGKVIRTSELNLVDSQGHTLVRVKNRPALPHDCLCFQREQKDHTQCYLSSPWPHQSTRKLPHRPCHRINAFSPFCLSQQRLSVDTGELFCSVLGPVCLSAMQAAYPLGLEEHCPILTHSI